MRIRIPFPSLAPHGGTRVAIAIANRLADRGHSVEFVCLRKPSLIEKNYWRWSKGVRVCSTPSNNYDVILITSPHSIHMAKTGKTVLHLQMLEHMFRPHDRIWEMKCEQMYRYPAPMFSISQWNIRELIEKYGRTEKNTIYIGNGVDEHDFPRRVDRDHAGDYILVEGWDAYNPCKDVDRVAPRVAAMAKKHFRIVAYGQVPPRDYREVIDEFHFKPSGRQILELYRNAAVLLKASRYDARSCSPVEAMTQGTLTVRAIVEGDDDLIDGYNCVRTEYDVDALWDGLNLALVGDHKVGDIHNYVSEFLSWDLWIDQIENKLREVAGK